MKAQGPVAALQGHVVAARRHFDQGDRARALEEIDRALALDPDYLAARLLKDSIVQAGPPSPRPVVITPPVHAELRWEAAPRLDLSRNPGVAPSFAAPMLEHETGTRSGRAVLGGFVAGAMVGLLVVVGTPYFRSVVNSVSSHQTVPPTTPAEEPVTDHADATTGTADAPPPIHSSERSASVQPAPPHVTSQPALPVVDDRRGVLSAVARYLDAYRAQSGAVGFGTGGCEVTIDVDTAVAQCGAGHDDGSQAPGQRAWTFHLTRNGDAWHIQEVTTADGPTEN